MGSDTSGKLIWRVDTISLGWIDSTPPVTENNGASYIGSTVPVDEHWYWKCVLKLGITNYSLIIKVTRENFVWVEDLKPLIGLELAKSYIWNEQVFVCLWLSVGLRFCSITHLQITWNNLIKFCILDTYSYAEFNLEV